MMSKPYIVILVGTDGSGKTSIALELESSLSIPVNYIYFGLKEYRLPGLDIWVKHFGDNGIIFRALVLPLEYLVRRFMFPRTGFVLLDRVPGWVFVGRSRFLYLFYKRILPKADFLVHCTGDPKLIFARKPERSLDEKLQNDWQALRPYLRQLLHLV